MLLYKYVSYDAGLEILRNNSIGFAHPMHFNDPFEIEALSYGPSRGRQIMASAMKYLGKQGAGVLSLTRASLNPLMWAHYGLGHTGMVIGIDATISEFVSEKTNLLPVQYGSVIYTNERPLDRLLTETKGSAFGARFHFEMGSLEQSQRMFLYKPMCWSYEEEVRVVKWLRGLDKSSCIESGTFRVITVGGRPLHLLDLPRGAIREVLLGIRSHPLMQSKQDVFVDSISQFQPGISIFGCKISKSSWNLEKYSLEESSRRE